MALYAYTSNRMELLVDELARVISENPLDPLMKETVIVQSRGMDRWLTFALARRLGAAVNFRFPFPAHFLGEVMTKLSSEEALSFSDWEPEIVAWEILKALPELMDKDSFQPIKNYISEEAGENNPLKAFELASQIASTFDHYLIFRPEMLRRWERGEDNHWQAVLWREVARRKEKRYPLLELGFTLKALEHADPHRWPPRISLFGLSYLPPVYLDLFLVFSRLMDVHCFLLNPCMEYWGDVLSPTEASYRLDKSQAGGMYFSPENSLLSSLGRRGREFFDLWIERITPFSPEERELFAEPGEDTLLHMIQSDILHLRERSENDKGTVPEGDDSIQIHSCHGPLREIEVLQDNLLEFLRRDETLKPSDILVMTPDIDTYAPYIRAVFTLPEDDPRYLPFSIADSVSVLTGPLTKTFFKMGRLKESRLKSTEVLDILSCPAVRKKFDLAEEQWEIIHEWVLRTGINWGWDASMRAKLDLPAIEVGTWEGGIKRMLLGYALPPESDRGEFAGVVPLGEIEGSDREILEGLLKFLTALKGFVFSLKEERSPANWGSLLKGAVESFFLPEFGEEWSELNRLYQAIGSLEITAKKASFEAPLPAEVAFEFIERKLALTAGASGFMTGGLTFCHMVPMRSIPFRVICLVGMNFESFPRPDRTPSFDLMAKNPKPGDPSKRYDDRYLFLEAILAARDKLYVSYTGRSPEDNEKLLPCVVVSEFSDYIQANFNLPRDIFIQHRLQAFSPAYFRTDSPLFTYARENLEGARAFLTPEKVSPIFFTDPLPPPREGELPPTVDNLSRFFSHPCRFLVRRRLDVNLSDDEPLVMDEEPFLLDSLQLYQLKERLVEDQGQGYLRCLVDGKLPYGSPGEILYASVRREIEELLHRKNRVSSGRGESIPVDLKIEGLEKTWYVRGVVKDVYPQGFVYLRPTKSHGSAMIVAWLSHLILSASLPSGAFRTFVIVTGKEFIYKRPEDPPGLLVQLLQLYDKGLCRPLKLFPEVSLTYVEHWRKNENEEKALSEARKKWEGEFRSYAYKSDPYHALCFKGVDPLDDEFEELALKVFNTIFDHLEDA